MQIPAYKLSDLQARIDAFNKKATKWGLPLVTYTIDSRKFVPVNYTAELMGDDGPKVEVLEVTVTGEVPRVAGWAVHSRVEPSSTPGANFVYTAPGFASVESLRTTGMICQHCNTSRGRSLVYLLQNAETGEQKLVGKSCIADFVPAQNAEALLSYSMAFASLAAGEEEDRDYSNAPRNQYVYPTETAIAEALILIEKFGYVSRKAADAYNDKVRMSDDYKESSLKFTTSSSMGIQDSKEVKRADYYSVAEIEAHAEAVQAVKAFIAAQPLREGDDFIYNLQTMIGQPCIAYRQFGYIAAAANMYIRSIEAAKETATRSNEWLGKVGERLTFADLKITRVNSRAGFAYNTFTYIIGMEDTAGNSLVWFSSNRIGNEGDIVTLKATVKAHDEFKGRKQTIITRGKVQE